MDTTDGVFMTKAYGWAFLNPLRKIFYNITVTSLSVVVALLVGRSSYSRSLSAKFRLHSAGSGTGSKNVDFTHIGYAIVAAFVVTWAVSIEERWGSMVERG